MAAALAILVHAVVPYRIAGHLLALGLIALLTSLDDFGIEHHLLRFGSAPKIALSDMNGLGHYLGPTVWFVAYWGAYIRGAFPSSGRDPRPRS